MYYDKFIIDLTEETYLAPSKWTLICFCFLVIFIYLIIFHLIINDNLEASLSQGRVLFISILSFSQTNQGIKCFHREKAGDIAGSDPDYAIRDLYNNIANGNFPSWTMYVQVMTFKEAENWKYNPFDLTKVSKENNITLFCSH